MNLKEFYTLCEGDYDSVLKRLSNDSRILKFLNLFLQDPSYNELINGLDKADFKAAFSASHSLKGVSANLNLDKLYKVSSELCEYLRNYTQSIADSTIANLLEQVIIEYNKVTKNIKLIDIESINK